MIDTNKKTEEMLLLGQAGYTKAAIVRQVETLCHSSEFEDQGKARGLLRFLIDEALAGRVPRPADIARKLGKQDFGPGDSYVRSVSADLRRLLKAHNDTAKPGEIRFVVPDKQYFVLAPRAAAQTETSPISVDSETQGSILEPADRAEVYQRVAVRGRIDALHLDLRVWLVVRTPGGDLYPQCRVTRNQPEWEHEVRIGRLQWGADENAEYVIMLVAANADGDAAFYNYLKSGRDGFGPLLPSDAVVLDSKRVTRLDIREV